MSIEDRPARVLVLVVPACEPERILAEQRIRAERLWQEVLAAVQRTVPGAAPLQPGCCGVRARGPTRYYGSEEAAARAILGCVSALLEGEAGEEVTLGIASGRFAAEQAARTDRQDPALQRPHAQLRIVDAEHTAEFLSRLPITRGVDEQLATVLIGLGVRTLGAFAALPEQSILQRFGHEAHLAHRRARGLGELHGAEVSPGLPLHDLSVSFDFEPPLEGVDQLAFACSSHAEKFVQVLTERALVCTELRVELLDDTGASHERSWSHPANFTATDIVNRVRWQAAALPQHAERGAAGIAAVRILPERTALAAMHEPGLWNDTPNERVHHQLTRVQSLLGPEGAGTGVILGGRAGTDRQRVLPWGARPDASTASAPWPGRLQGPLPTLIAATPAAATLLDAHGADIRIDDDELLEEAPARFCLEGGTPLPVQTWSAPWPLRELWWDAKRPREAVFRLQLVLENGEAWLLHYTKTAGWAAEGRYA